MTTAPRRDDNRRISSKEYNVFVSEGVEPHKATDLAPRGLLQPFPPELEKQFRSKHDSLKAVLLKLIGKPFYAEGGFFLYNGDSTEYLSRLSRSDFRVDLVITSPPYNIGKVYERQILVNDYISWCAGWMSQIYKVCKRNGTFWLNLGYLEVEDRGLCVPIPYLLWDKSSFYLLQEIVWKYGAGVSTKQRLSPRNEKWLFYVKDPGNYIFNLDEIRDPNVKYPNQKKNGKYRCNPLGKNPSDVWEFPKITTGESRSSRERTEHPAQFPLDIVERIVRVSSNQLDLVVDPFAGSCSAGIAAIGLGRLFLGFETRTDYCALAVNRVQQFCEERTFVQSQGQLF